MELGSSPNNMEMKTKPSTKIIIIIIIINIMALTQQWELTVHPSLMHCVEGEQGVGKAEREDGRGDGDIQRPVGDHRERGRKIP